MNSVRKMALVEPRMLENLQTKSPTLLFMNDLDKSMYDIIQEKEMSVDEKVKLYNQSLQRYLTFQSKQNVPMSISITETPSKTPRENVETSTISRLPSSLKDKAKSIFSHMKQSPLMTWNERGEFIFDGKLVPGSHIEDLMNDVLRRTGKVNPAGWQKFSEGLHNLNVPSTLIVNKKRGSRRGKNTDWVPY